MEPRLAVRLSRWESRIYRLAISFLVGGELKLVSLCRANDGLAAIFPPPRRRGRGSRDQLTLLHRQRGGGMASFMPPRQCELCSSVTSNEC